MNVSFIKNIKNKKLVWVFTILLAVTLVTPILALADQGDNWGLSSLSSGIEAVLWRLVNAVFAWLVMVSGVLLDIAVTKFVVGFGDLYITTGLGFAVDRLWETVRDIFNLTFIFGLVYIGFKIILNASDTSARKMLAYIIMAALLVNFSLFFTKFVVDFSNIAATQVAQAFDHTSGNFEVSEGFMNILGFSSIWGSDSLSNFSNNTVSSGYTYIFGSMILFIIISFVFFAGAFLLLIRFVVLNIYMVLSPVMFLGWVFPNLAEYSKEYWNGFLRRAFFAPAYLLMLYFAYYILTNFSHASNSPKFVEVFAKNPTTTTQEVVFLIAMFAITCGFLIASIVVADKMGANGASGVINIGRNLAGRARRVTQRGAGSITFGLAAGAGQRTIGYGANKFANSKWLQDRSSSLWGQSTLKAARGVADSSFDARRVGGFGKVAGIGEGKAGGYATRMKDKIKADEDYLEKYINEVKTRDADGNLLAEKAEEIKKIVENDNDYKPLKEKMDTLKEEVKNNEKALADKQAELTKTVKPDQEQLKKLQEDYSKETDPLKASAIDRQIKDVQKNIADKEKQFGSDINKLQENLKTSRADLSTTTKDAKALYEKLEVSAEAGIRFANRLAFIEKREKQSNFYTLPRRILGKKGVIGTGATGVTGVLAGGAGGYGVAAATGASAGAAAGTILVPAAISGIAVESLGDIYGASAGNMRKKYGTGGVVRLKKEKQKKTLKLLDEVREESGDSGSNSSSGSGSSSDSSDNNSSSNQNK